MASDGEASCVCDPNFAIICSFLEKFAKTCGITHPNFLDLQEMLENTQEVAQPLIELHLKLLRKARKSVSSERWEKALIKFCHTYSKPDGWELERFGYKKVPLSLKLRLLKGLLEVQFDFNAKFKADVNRLSSEELRLQPIGRDKLGHTYWSQLDEDCNLRVYREDLDDESWEIVARDREGLFKLIGQLSSNEPFNSELDALLNEDSNSQEIENPITDTGQVSKSPDSDEDVDDEGEFEEIETGDEDDFDETDDEKEVKKVAPSNDSNSLEKAKDEPEKIGDEASSNDIRVGQPVKVEQDGNSGKVDLTNKVGGADRLDMEVKGNAKQVSSEIAQDLSQPKSAHGKSDGVTDTNSPAKQSAASENAHHTNPSLATDLSVKKTSNIKDTKVTDLKRERDSDSLDAESATKKKRHEDVGATIEEPVMLIRGDGSGKDCNTGNSGNIFCTSDSEHEAADFDVGQAIEEPVMVIWGFGSGRDCDTGNPGKSSDTANGSEEKNDVNQKVDQPKDGISENAQQSKEANKDASTSLGERTVGDESARQLNSKPVLSDNELFQESMFKDSLNVKLKKGQSGETSKGTEPCPVASQGALPMNEKSPGGEGNLVIPESPSNGDKTKATEAPLPVTKRFLHLSTNTSQSTSFVSSPSQDIAAPTTPVTKSPPKLWTIENICAKPSSETSLVSSNTEEDDKRAKVQLGVQVLPKSTSPSKRASRWDVGKPGEDEVAGKCSVSDASSEKISEPGHSPAVRTLFGVKDSTVASEIQLKVQASEVGADNVLNFIPGGTSTISEQHKVDSDVPKSEESLSGTTVSFPAANKKEDLPKEKVEETKVEKIEEEEEEPQFGFFFGPGCLKKPASNVKNESKIIEVPKGSPAFEAVDKQSESGLKKHDGSSKNVPAKPTSTMPFVSGEAKVKDISKLVESTPSLTLPSSNKLDEQKSITVSMEAGTKINFEAEKLTKSLDSNKVPEKALLEEAKKVDGVPISPLGIAHLNKVESPERNIFPTTPQTVKESTTLQPMLVNDSKTSSEKKSPDLPAKVVKQDTDIQPVSEKSGTIGRNISKQNPGAATASDISSLAGKSVTQEKDILLDNKTDSSKDTLVAAKVGDSIKTIAAVLPAIHSPETVATAKQTVPEVKALGIEVLREAVPVKQAVKPLQPVEKTDKNHSSDQKSSSSEAKSESLGVLETFDKPGSKSDDNKEDKSQISPSLEGKPRKNPESAVENLPLKKSVSPEKKTQLMPSENDLKSSCELPRNETLAKKKDETARSSTQAAALPSKLPTIQKECKSATTASLNVLQEIKEVPPLASQEQNPVKTNTQLTENVHAVSSDGKQVEAGKLTSVKDSPVLGSPPKISPKKPSICSEKSVAVMSSTENVQDSVVIDSPSKNSPNPNVTHDKNTPFSEPSSKDEQVSKLTCPINLSPTALKTGVDQSTVPSEPTKLKISSTEIKTSPKILVKSDANKPDQTSTAHDAQEIKVVSDKLSSVKSPDKKSAASPAVNISPEKDLNLTGNTKLSTSVKLPEAPPVANIIAAIPEVPNNRDLALSAKPSKKEIVHEINKDKIFAKAPSVAAANPVQIEATGEDPTRKGLPKVQVPETSSSKIEKPFENLSKSKPNTTEKSNVEAPKAIIRVEPPTDGPTNLSNVSEPIGRTAQSLKQVESQRVETETLKAEISQGKIPTEAQAKGDVCKAKPSEVEAPKLEATKEKPSRVLPETPISELPKKSISKDNLPMTDDLLKAKPSAAGPPIIKPLVAIIEPSRPEPTKTKSTIMETPKEKLSNVEQDIQTLNVDLPKLQPLKVEDTKETSAVVPPKAESLKKESTKVHLTEPEDLKVQPPKVQPSRSEEVKVVQPPKLEVLPSRTEDLRVERSKVQPAKSEDLKVEPQKVPLSRKEDLSLAPPTVQPSKADLKVEPIKMHPSKSAELRVEPLTEKPSKVEDLAVEPLQVGKSKTDTLKVEPTKMLPAEDFKVEPLTEKLSQEEVLKVVPPKVQPSRTGDLEMGQLTVKPEIAQECKEEQKVEPAQEKELAAVTSKVEPPSKVQKSAVETSSGEENKPVKSNASKLREIKKIQKPKSVELEDTHVLNKSTLVTSAEPKGKALSEAKADSVEEKAAPSEEAKGKKEDVPTDDSTPKAEPKQASILGLSFDYNPEQSTSKPPQNNRGRKTRASAVDGQDGESGDADPLGDSTDVVSSRSPRKAGAASGPRSKRKRGGADPDRARTPDDEEATKKKGRGRPVRGGTQRKGAAKDRTDASEQSDDVDTAELGVDLVCDESSIESMPSKAKRPSPQKSKSPKKTRKLLGLDVPVELETPAADSGPPVRQSRRIAQIKIKEDAERREMEEATRAAIAQEEALGRKKKHKHGSKQTSERDSSDQDNDNDKDFESTKRKKRKKRKKDWNRKDFDQSNPWRSSSGSSSSMEEEDDEQEQSEEDEPAQRLTDHEFSPESDLEDDSAAQPLRRARTARKESAPPEEPADEADCQKCGKSDHPEWILLCDKCDAGWHCLCLRPALLVIPEGDWFCPPCQHTALIKSLHEQLKAFDGAAKRRENEELRKKRLAYVGISLDNVLPKTDGKDEAGSGAESEGGVDAGAEGAASSRSSSSAGSSSDGDSEPVYQLRERRSAHFSYRFNEYDDLINSAIQDEMEVAKVAGNQGRGKDIGTIIEAEREEAAATGGATEANSAAAEADAEFQPEPEDEEDEEEEEDGYIPPVRKSVAKKKHRKLNSLDISSDDENGDSDEDFKGSSSDDEDEDYEEGDTDDSDVVGRGRRGRGKSSGPVRRSNRSRVTRFDREFIDDDSDDSDKPARKRKPRNVWDDTSESEESDSTWGRRKKQKQRSPRTKAPRSSEKKKKKRRKRAAGGSDNETFRASKPKKPRVSFGAPDDLETVATARRTRGQKINYVEMAGSDSDEEFVKPSKKIVESEDEFVLNEEDEELMDVEDEAKDSDNESADLDEQFGEDSENEDAPPPVVPVADRKDRSKKDSKKKKKAEFRARMLQSDNSDEEPEETAFDETLDQSDPVIDEEALAREEKRLMKEAKKLEKKELKKKGKKKKEELELSEPPPPVEPAEPIPVEPLESPAKRKGRGRGKAALAKAAAAEGPSPAPGAAPPPFPQTPPAAAAQGHSVISRMLQAQPLPGPLPGSGPVSGVHSFTDAASAMGQKYFGDRPPGDRMGMGDRLTMGDRMPPGDRLTMGDRMPPGDRLSMGDRMPPGDRLSMGDRMSMGERMPSGDRMAMGDRMPAVDRMAMGDRMSMGDRMPPGDRMSMGDRMPPGDRMPMGDRMGPRGLPPSARPPYLPRGRMPLAYRQPRSPAPHFGGPRGPAGHPALYHSAHHPHDPSPSGGGPIAISPGLDKPGHGTPPPAYARPPAATMGRFGPDGAPSPNGGVRHPFPAQPGNHMLGRAGTPPGRNPGPGNFSPYHQPAGYHYGGYPGAGPLGPDEPGSYQGAGYPEAYGSSPLATSDGSNSKPMDEEGSGEFGGLVSYFSSQREDDLDA